MEKLGQLHADAVASGRWDLIVVDTPPSRSALDFLDAPDRLAGFLDGRLIRILLTPARGPARLMTAGLGMVTGTLTKVLGAQMLRDVQSFVAALDTLFGGFRQRAQKTYQLLQADGTAFLVVAAPEPDALREAAYFVERLNEERMPLAGLVVNRAHREPRGRLSTERALVAAERLEEATGRAARRRVSPPRCCGCTPTAAASSRARRGCGDGSPRPTRTCRRPSCRHCPRTCTTSTASGWSATCGPCRPGSQRLRSGLAQVVAEPGAAQAGTSSGVASPSPRPRGRSSPSRAGDATS